VTNPLPRPETVAWAERRLGGPFLLRPRGSLVERSRVWTLRCADGRQAVLKEPSSRRKHEQELCALTDWAPRLSGLAPRLIDALDEPLALLIEALPGRPGDRALGSAELELAAHRAAGAALGRLHALPVSDPDPLPLAEALPRRLSAWLDRAGGLVDAGTRRRASERFGDGAAFEGQARAACHRDVEPRNWLVVVEESRLRRLSLIDFEHARLDCALVDLVKLASGAWAGRPDLEAEFLEGRGGALGEADRDRLERLAILHDVATLVRAAEHGDSAGRECARDRLDRTLSPR
jgi:hypothetical protein